MCVIKTSRTRHYTPKKNNQYSNTLIRSSTIHDPQNPNHHPNSQPHNTPPSTRTTPITHINKHEKKHEIFSQTKANKNIHSKTTGKKTHRLVTTQLVIQQNKLRCTILQRLQYSCVLGIVFFYQVFFSRMDTTYRVGWRFAESAEIKRHSGVCGEKKTAT